MSAITTELVLDGGLATSLEAHGHDLSGKLWSGRLLLEAPAAITQVHREHAAAGGDVLTTASYQISRQGFADLGLDPTDADRAIARSVALARSAAVEVGEEQGRQILVAASIGPYGAVLADGSEYRGDYRISRAKLMAFHLQRLEAVLATAPDLLAFETIPSLMELEVIAEIIQQNDLPPAWVSMSAQDGSRISDGTAGVEAFELFADLPLAAIGFNCTKPEHISSLLTATSELLPSRVRVVYPNAGRTWDAAGRRWLDIGMTAIPAELMGQWRQLGAGWLGGCCGLGTDQVSAVRRLLHNSETEP